MPVEQIKTQVLLLHSEQSTLDKMSASFGDRYTVHCATSGVEALNTLGDTPIHVIVSASTLPGMSGAEALREAKKRSPETLGILLASNDDPKVDSKSGDKELFQVIRGGLDPLQITQVVEAAFQEFKTGTSAEPANDTSADEDTHSHVVVETAENGTNLVSDGTGQHAVLQVADDEDSTPVGANAVAVIVMSRDEDFLNAIKECCRGMHTVYTAKSVKEADSLLSGQPIGVSIIDASLVGPNLEKLLRHLQEQKNRLVPIVAGKREDGDKLIDLINRGKAYRFILKPASAGRVKLALDASVRHHMDGPYSSFTKTSSIPLDDPRVAEATGRFRALASAKTKEEPKKPAEAPKPVVEKKPEPPKAVPVFEPPANSGPDLAEVLDDEDTRFAQTVKGIVEGTHKHSTDFEASDVHSLDTAMSDSGAPDWLKPAAIGGTAVVVLAAIGFFALSGGDSETAPEQAVDNTITSAPAPIARDSAEPEQAATTTPAVAEPAPITREPVAEEPVAVPEATDRATDELVAEAGVADTVVDVSGDITAIETALLEGRLDDARALLTEVSSLQPDNTRLPFLEAQLSQGEIRRALDTATLAVREKRYQDAATALGQATDLGADEASVRLIQQEIDEARSTQRISQVLAIANTRLTQGFLVEPANDNARYLFELVLSNDPDNTSARQGLSAIAGKLVLGARAAIDNQDYDGAEALLKQAGEIDADSADLETTWQALTAARDAIVARERAAVEQAAAEQAAAEAAAAEAAQAAAAEAERPVPVSSLTRTKYVAPRYPRAAERRGLNGWVDVVFTVQLDGSVRDVEVLNSDPGTIFESAAVDAVERWEFEPIVEDGAVVEKKAGVRLMFALE